ncbi:hypothetical protein TWF281_006596 [Arthrobotrys megalospora]
MDKRFTFSKQNGATKEVMYSALMERLQQAPKLDDGHRSLILDMLAATNTPEMQPKERRWLLEHCMRRTAENRRSRARAKDPHVRKRVRGIARFQNSAMPS